MPCGNKKSTVRVLIASRATINSPSLKSRGVYKLVFYVPASHLETVKDAVFATGAGSFGHYDHCCWQVLGEGQFRPLPGSSPHLGRANRLTIVSEYRVELICAEALITTAVAALKAAHPYEEPAYDLQKLEMV